MSQVSDNFTVCDQCGGAIPSTASRISDVSLSVIVSGSQTGLSGKDFCCTAHASAYITGQTNVATPSPAYSPPPAT